MPGEPQPSARLPREEEVPELAASVRFEPTGGDDTIVVSVDGVPVSRASSATVELLRSMDGTLTEAELRDRFAPDESSEAFSRLVRRFRAAGLLRGSERRPAGRLAYRPPLTVQVATLRAPGAFARLELLLRPLLRRALLWPVGLLVLSGLVALAVQAGDAATALTSPLPLTDVLVVAIVLVSSTLVHELAHGLTLTRLGPRPRRAGVMLLYLTPAFFVDVTDAWRLPNRRGRVAVALAGPAVHVVVAASCALISIVVGDSAARRTLLVLACACVGVVAVNLIPFVRFDGYIALMSALDEPDLRSRAIRDATAALRRRLFGGREEPRQLSRWWSVPFGLASIVFPVALVLYAMARLCAAVSGGGVIGAISVLGVQLLVVAALGGTVLGWLRSVARSGVCRVRMICVVAAAVAATAVVGAVVTVPVTRAVGFVQVDREVLLVEPVSNPSSPAPPEHAAASLRTRGIVADAVVGTGDAQPGIPYVIDAPTAAVAPIVVPDAEIPVVVIGSVRVTSGVSLPAAGLARIDLGTQSVWSALWSTNVWAPVRTLLPSTEPAHTFSDQKEGSR
jgi:putative peptide zinc metalloprotease protein